MLEKTFACAKNLASSYFVGNWEWSGMMAVFAFLRSQNVPIGPFGLGITTMLENHGEESILSGTLSGPILLS